MKEFFFACTAVVQLRNKRRVVETIVYAYAFWVVLEAAFGPKFRLVILRFGEKDETWMGKINNTLSLTFE